MGTKQPSYATGHLLVLGTKQPSYATGHLLVMGTKQPSYATGHLLSHLRSFVTLHGRLMLRYSLHL
jgi:hypothetical protein